MCVWQSTSPGRTVRPLRSIVFELETFSWGNCLSRLKTWVMRPVLVLITMEVSETSFFLFESKRRDVWTVISELWLGLLSSAGSLPILDSGTRRVIVNRVAKNDHLLTWTSDEASILSMTIDGLEYVSCESGTALLMTSPPTPHFHHFRVARLVGKYWPRIVTFRILVCNDSSYRK